MLGEISATSIGIGGEARWGLTADRRRMRPYLGGGLAIYAVNVEGRGISGTLVEKSLDNLTTGVAALGGFDLLVLPNFAVGGQARYELLSGVRYGSLRAGGSYIFHWGS